MSKDTSPTIGDQSDTLGIRFIRDLDAEPVERREALLAAVQDMVGDDSGELRKPA